MVEALRYQARRRVPSLIFLAVLSLGLAVITPWHNEPALLVLAIVLLVFAIGLLAFAWWPTSRRPRTQEAPPQG